MEKLLPCPCCGGKAEINYTSLPDSYSDYEQVGCTNCGVSVPLWNNGEQNGVEKWNTRTPPEATQ